MTETIYSISGNKLESLLITSDVLLFSSQSFNNAEDFRTAWSKKVSLATKVEIKYDIIKSVKKEDDDDEILIKYKGALGIPSECEFSFMNKNDAASFLQYLETEHHFTHTTERLSPIKSARPYIIGLVISIGITVFAHYQAVAIANGTANESSSRKTQMFNNIVEMLGDKGVIGIGVLVCVFIMYTIWKRFTNPPMLTTLIPK